MSIEDKIAAYLKQQQKKARSPKEAENIAQVAYEVENSGGECVGLSISWAYSKKTRIEAESSGSGLSFFNRINGLLLDWDGTKEFSKEEQHNIDRFIENVIYYQRAQNQNYVPGETDFHQQQHAQNFKLLESETDSKGRKFRHSYQTDYLYLSKELLEDRLAKVIMPETMTFLTIVIDKKDNKADSSFVYIAEGFIGHMVSVYHNNDDNQYYYYNSNNGKELVFSNIKDLASKVWDDSAKRRFDKGFPKFHVTDAILRELRVDVMQFTHETRNQYPKLLELAPSLEENRNFLKDGKIVLKFVNDPMIKRYFLSLNKDCQLEFLDKVEDENAKKNLIKLLMDNMLKINNFNEQIVDPAIIPGLLSKYKSIIDLLVKEKQLNQSMVEELSLSAGFLSGVINRISSTLDEALQNGALDKVQYLFTIGAKLGSGSFAVKEMIKNGNRPILSYLVQEKHLDLYQFETVTYQSTEYPPKIIATDKFNCNNHPIIFAAKKGSKEILKFLVENLDPNRKEENSKILNEALYWACLEGKVDKAEFLLQKGANPYVVAGINHNIIYDDKYHSTPQNALEAACRSHNSLELITKLLQHKADISQYRTLGFLCESILDSPKRCKAAALLLENGASPNVKADYISNPLLVACELLDVELVALLLQYGANPNSEIDTRFSFKDTALVVACRQRTYEKHKNPEDNPKYQIVKLLLENGANPVPNKQGLNPIDYINEENDVGLKELINTKQISVPEKLKKAPAPLIACTSATKVEKDQFRTK